MTVVQLQNEGISTVDEPNDFDKDTLKQVADNLRNPNTWSRNGNDNPNAAVRFWSEVSKATPGSKRNSTIL